jgi:hypothetical protein
MPACWQLQKAHSEESLCYENPLSRIRSRYKSEEEIDAIQNELHIFNTSGDGHDSDVLIGDHWMEPGGSRDG